MLRMDPRLGGDLVDFQSLSLRDNHLPCGDANQNRVVEDGLERYVLYI